MKTLKPLLFLLFQQMIGHLFAQSALPWTNFESLANLNTLAIPTSLGAFQVNPAALSFSEQSGVSFFQQHYLQVPNLLGNAIAFQKKQKISYGLSLQQFGNASTNLFQQRASFSTKLFAQFGLGVSLGFQTFPLESGNRLWQPFLGLGFCWWYSKQFQLGVYIQQPLGESKLLNLAGTWQCTPHFRWSLAIQQQALLPHQIRSSFSYFLAKDVQVQVAFGFIPVLSTLAFEFPFKKALIGLGMMQHTLLGFQSGLSFKHPIK
jgi:uncharacterized protein YejL (UPF0352 family)